ncbi:MULTISPECIES: methyltransferase [Methylosinus]|uniref:Methyltransferase n=1 Tax=Methylosinus trichosporium (strain ATCC 35070 / NCIMB 11131 / UNIQEM 75 / OB3b) TaxID=595536 RepID=A0A2D2D5Z0_METT3|nr:MULTISPECIES: methyltransferase [Methylosinus]ATQ70385.1 methyltransferase [Methylosinus trichosporium OB3b]OBS53212.1 methyltransferase [Methylosinus sp. 3S-1]
MGQFWRDRLRRIRDRLASSPRFQRLAAKHPLTRKAARRRARAALDLCAGFVYSQVLLACVRLKLLDLLLESPKSLAQIAEKTELSPDAASRLLDAAASLGLVDRRGKDRYGLGDIGAALVGNKAALALVEHQPMLYADLADPVALLRGAEEAEPKLADYWPYSAAERPTELTPEEVAPYSALMAQSQPLVAQEVVGAYNFRRHRRIMDVGGGEGAFLEAVAASAPRLELMLFDLPAVVERARTRLEAAGLAKRARFFSGSFLTDPLPVGADVITLVRIVHDHDDATALELLRNVRRALPRDGVLLIVEAMSGIEGAEPLDAYYGFYTLAMGRGEPRTVAELQRIAKKAGFGRFRLLRNAMPIVAGILVARPDPDYHGP